MSGTKASQQARTTKKILAYLKTLMVPTGASTYQLGWNNALETAIREVEGGTHLAPAPAPKPRSITVSSEGVHVEGPLSCGATDGSDLPCIHPAGHVEKGQPIHSNGRRTWRTRR